MKTIARLIWLAIVGTVSQARLAADTKPNIVYSVADDLGWKDVGFNGCTDIKTPNLDRLAANGLRFTQFYNTARCWPTRSSLLTGYYAQQIGMDPPKGKLPESVEQQLDTVRIQEAIDH